MIKWKKIGSGFWEGYINNKVVLGIMCCGINSYTLFMVKLNRKALAVEKYTSLSNAKRAAKTLINKLQYK